MTATVPQQRAGCRRADVALRPQALVALAAALVMACGGSAGTVAAARL